MPKHLIIHDTGRFNIARYREYDYFHHWSGHSIAVLPILKPDCQVINFGTKPVGHEVLYSNQYLYCFRKEDLPCWQAASDGQDELGWTCVTGGVDVEKDGGTVQDNLTLAMLRELREEVGLVPKEYETRSEGPMFTSKGTNLKVMHYVLWISSATFYDPTPDSSFESHAQNHWLPLPEVLKIRSSLDLHSRNLLRMAKIT